MFLAIVMSDPVFFLRSLIPAAAEDVYRWHTRPGAFERLVPPWQHIELIERQGSIRDGDRLTLRIGPGLVGRTWVAEHVDHIPDRQFRDVQVRGPFSRWVHTHRFEPVDAQSSWLEDHVEYRLPGGALGRLLGARSMERMLRSVFAYRHRVTAADVVEHATFADRPRRRILLSGASGLVGRALGAMLSAGGHEVLRLVRNRPRSSDQRRWDPATGQLEPESLAGCDTVIHLAGESIAGGRWTTTKKSRILRSRVDSTRLLCERLARMSQGPRTVLIASAIGFYGNAEDAWLDENSASGTGFLADVCRQWEAAADPAIAAGLRVVFLRFGIILSPAGGALRQMLTPFRLGVGGRIGSGRQWMSWIALDDVLGAIHRAMWHDTLAGPVNVVAPEPVTNADFTFVLGSVLRRPTVLPLPAQVARLALGQMADELLLTSQRVAPAKLNELGYPFRYPTLESALRHELGLDAPR